MRYTYCLKCQDETDSLSPITIEKKFNKKKNKSMKVLYSKCSICTSIKARIVKDDTLLDLTEEQLLNLLLQQKNQ